VLVGLSKKARICGARDIEGGRKHFFFEKKKQKTFAPGGVGDGDATARSK